MAALMVLPGCANHTDEAFQLRGLRPESDQSEQSDRGMGT